jgi:hypothetical protein
MNCRTCKDLRKREAGNGNFALCEGEYELRRVRRRWRSVPVPEKVRALRYNYKPFRLGENKPKRAKTDEPRDSSGRFLSAIPVAEVDDRARAIGSAPHARRSLNSKAERT